MRSSVEKAKARCGWHRTPLDEKCVSPLRNRHEQYDNIILSSLVKGCLQAGVPSGWNRCFGWGGRLLLFIDASKSRTTPRLMDATIIYRGGK